MREELSHENAHAPERKPDASLSPEDLRKLQIEMAGEEIAALVQDHPHHFEGLHGEALWTTVEKEFPDLVADALDHNGVSQYHDEVFAQANEKWEKATRPH